MLHDGVLTREQAISTLGTDKELSCCFWGKLYCRHVLKDISFPLIRYGEDAWVFPHILDNCMKISVVSNLTYYYVQRPGSAIRTTDDEIVLESILACLHVAEYLEKHNLSANALTYYRGAIYKAMRVKDRKKARELIVPNIDRETRRKLLLKVFRTDIRWISLYVPWVFSGLKAIQRLLRGNREAE